MPIYKNRVLMDAATELRRYITLDALVQILRSGQLRLTRIDKLDDPFEGSVTKKQIDDQVPIFSSRNANQMMCLASYYPDMDMPPRRSMDPWTELKRRRQAMTRSAHTSCWTAGPESEAMWRLYCREGGQEGQGVSLRSTLGKIETSVECHDLFVSPIRYRDYHEGDAFDDDLDQFMHKRQGFAHEREVRLLKWDKSHYFDLAAAIASGDPTRAPSPELPEHIFLDWSPATVIERITISPYADESYETRARNTIASIVPSLVDRLELSVLSERRYPPQF
jgi:hypothetical protein